MTVISGRDEGGEGRMRNAKSSEMFTSKAVAHHSVHDGLYK
jgi:hypothetical protein